MTARLHITAEGQTEERYTNKVLVPHLGNLFQVVVDVRCVKTGRKRGQDYRGGLLDYRKARQDILDWLMEERRNPDAWFTTMFDLYALPDDFPGYASARQAPNPYQRVQMLETALQNDLGHPRFIPYIQLHEFEALLLSDPQKLDCEYLEHASAIKSLLKMVANRNPEEINDGVNTAPSKRIIAEIRQYEYQKASVGPLVAAKIGLTHLRKTCLHFNEWLTKLEKL